MVVAAVVVATVVVAVVTGAVAVTVVVTSVAVVVVVSVVVVVASGGPAWIRRPRAQRRTATAPLQRSPRDAASVELSPRVLRRRDDPPGRSPSRQQPQERTDSAWIDPVLPLEAPCLRVVRQRQHELLARGPETARSAVDSPQHDFLRETSRRRRNAAAHATGTACRAHTSSAPRSGSRAPAHRQRTRPRRVPRSQPRAHRRLGAPPPRTRAAAIRMRSRMRHAQPRRTSPRSDGTSRRSAHAPTA